MKKLASLLLLILLVAASVACSSDDEDPPDQNALNPTIPSSTGDRCEDPAGDITDDATAPGVGTEPAGIDITSASAERLDDDSIEVSFTTVGPIDQTSGTTFVFAQGTAASPLSFEIQAIAGENGSWKVDAITWDPAQQSTSVPVVPTVSANTLRYTLPPMNDLPPLGLHLQFGASAELAGGRVLDDCSSLTTAGTVG